MKRLCACVRACTRTVIFTSRFAFINSLYRLAAMPVIANLLAQYKLTSTVTF